MTNPFFAAMVLDPFVVYIVGMSLVVILAGIFCLSIWYYIKAKDLEAMTKLISYLREQGVWTVFHYVPLHSSKAGMRFGRFHGEDVYTTKESERLMRLPLFYNLKEEEMEQVVRSLLNYPDWN